MKRMREGRGRAGKEGRKEERGGKRRGGGRTCSKRGSDVRIQQRGFVRRREPVERFWNLKFR